MKITNSIRQLFTNQEAINKILRSKVDKLIGATKEEQWHYISRIKTLESFALKLETGRVENPRQMEDFFACTIVVENIGAIKRARKLINTHFKIYVVRPESDSITKKESSSFIFDDLRLYVSIKPTNSSPKGPINDLKFEIQIKTFLQHAWSIATHDLIYKSETINWTRQRVAYQVKAMLESAEVSIERADSVKKLKGIPSDHANIQKQNLIKQFLQRNFTKESLPRDLVRLIGNIEHLKRVLNIPLEDVEKSLEKETQEGRGTNTLNLSPYLIILQSVVNQNTKEVNGFLKQRKKTSYNTKIFVPLEIDLSKLGTNIPFDRIIR